MKRGFQTKAVILDGGTWGFFSAWGYITLGNEMVVLLFNIVLIYYNSAIVPRNETPGVCSYKSLLCTSFGDEASVAGNMFVG